MTQAKKLEFFYVINYNNSLFFNRINLIKLKKDQD